jgi:hypothetical protein
MMTPLLSTVRKGDPDFARWIIDRGGDKSATDVTVCFWNKFPFYPFLSSTLASERLVLCYKESKCWNGQAVH